MGTAQIGVLGLGVMGQNLALNLAENGLRVAGHDAWPEPVDKLTAAAGSFPVEGYKDLEGFVQALDDTVLKELGRMHTAREALDAVAVARSCFDRYSFDLIYARPRQTPQQWADELKRAIAEAAEHLSLYQLTIEADTPFAALHAAGRLVTPRNHSA